MKAQIITDRKLWNDFVEKSIHCNLTQTYEWGELMQELQTEPLHIGVMNEEGQLCAAILILISKLPLMRTPYFYAPRGPVIDDPTSPAMTVLLNFVKAEARKCGACMLKIEPDAPDGDTQWLTSLQTRGFRPNPYAHHLRREWVLDVRPSEQELLAKMHKKTRQYIRTSSRTGVTIRPGTVKDDIDTFYEIYIQTAERSNFGILPKTFYARMIELYGENAAFFIAEYEGKPIAAAIILRHGEWCWNMYEAASEQSRELRINYLLQWQRILWAKAQGCRYFNSRGIPDKLEEDQELYGVYNFKRGFGGFDIRYLQTHDLVYRPISYAIYRILLDAKHWYNDRQAAKKEAEKNTKGDKKNTTPSQTSQGKEKDSAKVEV
jgi:lipid II:glycine glycyltransferase (peptidoglycan interpeptide bridge formation enzyme)